MTEKKEIIDGYGEVIYPVCKRCLKPDKVYVNKSGDLMCSRCDNQKDYKIGLLDIRV